MQHIETVIIGAGQAGLSTAYHLKRKGRECVVLDANQRIGDGWRQQWDSLRLYSPAKYDGLPGMPFPGNPHAFPSKDDLAGYLETYARRWDLPVRLGVRDDPDLGYAEVSSTPGGFVGWLRSFDYDESWIGASVDVTPVAPRTRKMAAHGISLRLEQGLDPPLCRRLSDAVGLASGLAAGLATGPR